MDNNVKILHQYVLHSSAVALANHGKERETQPRGQHAVEIHENKGDCKVLAVSKVRGLCGQEQRGNREDQVTQHLFYSQGHRVLGGPFPGILTICNHQNFLLWKCLVAKDEVPSRSIQQVYY